jgi:hypothetical protein
MADGLDDFATGFVVRASASRSLLHSSIMSPDDAFGPRPPPPPPPLASSTSPPTTAPSGQGSPLHHAPQISPLRRLAVQPPRLRTAALAPQGTPPSASNLSVPYSPFAGPTPSSYTPSPSAYTPSPSPYASSPLPSASPMAMRNTSVPYNPQQWSRTAQLGGQYAPHPAAQAATRPHEVTGMEGNSRPFLQPAFLCSEPACSRTIRPSLSLNVSLRCCEVN